MGFRHDKLSPTSGHMLFLSFFFFSHAVSYPQNSYGQTVTSSRTFTLPATCSKSLSRQPALEHPPGLFHWHSRLIVSITARITVFLYQLVNLLSYSCLSTRGSRGGREYGHSRMGLGVCGCHLESRARGCLDFPTHGKAASALL